MHHAQNYFVRSDSEVFKRFIVDVSANIVSRGIQLKRCSCAIENWVDLQLNALCENWTCRTAASTMYTITLHALLCGKVL